MEEDLLTNLPQELIIEILSWLPIPTIMSSKRVCKSWRSMLESLEFANIHLSKSVPALVVQQLHRYHGFKVFEFNPRWNVSFRFCFPLRVLVKSSVDGLLFMIKDSKRRKRLYICNPINREYITLPRPAGCAAGIFGFGVSKRTRQYKLVMIARSCHIYTLGTGCWRSIPTESQLFESGQTGVFLNGNLPWLASDSSGTKLEIRCLDLETERLSTFSLLTPQLGYTCKTLTAWGDRLFFLGGYSDSPPPVIHVWSMKTYGDEKSWTRVLVFKQRLRRNLSPTKIFIDGDFWFSVGYGDELVCFSTKTSWIFR